MHTVLRWMAIVIAGCGAFFNLPALALGCHFLWDWVRVHSSDGVYFRWPYLVVGLVCLLLSGLGLGLAARAIWKKSFCVIVSVASLFLGLGGALILPDVGPQIEMAGANQRILGHADHSLSDWDEAHARFPSSEKELREAFAVRPLQEPAIYFQQGKPIPYDVRIVSKRRWPFGRSCAAQSGNGRLRCEFRPQGLLADYDDATQPGRRAGRMGTHCWRL